MNGGGQERLAYMSSTIGGQDPAHGWNEEEKDRQEKRLREEARKLRRDKKPRDAKKRLDRANEISRERSKRAHQ
jgi:hypothetical protein